MASGGTDRSCDGLDQRLSVCLEYCGGEYLDTFMLEYIVPDELDDDGRSSSMKPGPELAAALKHTQQWVENGSVRYIGISTHSHVVGKALSSSSEVDILNATLRHVAQGCRKKYFNTSGKRKWQGYHCLHINAMEFFTRWYYRRSMDSGRCSDFGRLFIFCFWIKIVTSCRGSIAFGKR